MTYSPTFTMLPFTPSNSDVGKCTLTPVFWSSNFINGLLNTSSEGLSTQSLEQGGIGLLMTMLIISVPPMAGNFFSATLGSYMPYSAFNGAASRPGPQGQPPGMLGFGGHGPSQVLTQSQTGNQGGSGTFNTSSSSLSRNDPRLGGVGLSVASDTVKQTSGLANPPIAG